MKALVPRRTVNVDPERLQKWLDGFVARHGQPVVEQSEDSVLVTAPDGAQARIRSPWPLRLEENPLATLVATMTRPRVIGALIVRKQAHAVGVFDGNRLIAGRHHSHYVQGRTKAGGWSQQRYARRRENQSSRSFDAAAADAEALLLPELSRMEALATGGDRAGVTAVLARPTLAPLAALAGRHELGVIAVPDPNARILADFGARFRQVAIELNELA